MECLETGLVMPDDLLTTPSPGLVPPAAAFAPRGDTVTVTGDPAGNDSRRDIPPPNLLKTPTELSPESLA
jgi:hypothetical protein